MSKPAFDFDAIEDTEAELPSQSRVIGERKWDHNPLMPRLVHSYELLQKGENPGRQMTVPGTHSREAAAGLRNAADQMTEEGTPVGVRLIFLFNDDNGEETRSTLVTELPTDDRPVKVLYAAKRRRRTLTDEQKEEAQREGFVSDDGKVNGRAYLDWVEAGRPRA